MFAGCGSKSRPDNVADGQVPSSDSVWIVAKGQHKTDVRNLFLQRGMRVEDDALSNSVIGASGRSIRWVNADWDMAVCRFDADNKLSAVSIVRSGEFEDGEVMSDSLMSVVYELQRIFGESKPLSSEKWQFINTEHVNVSITSDRNTTVDVIWE